MSLSILHTFSSKSFIVSGLTFRSLIHFEFIFLYDFRKCSNFILLHVQFSQHHLLKRLSLPHCMFLPPLLKIRYPGVHGFISGLSILFHWSMFLFLCQYHTQFLQLHSSLQDCFGSSGSFVFLYELRPKQTFLQRRHTGG